MKDALFFVLLVWLGILTLFCFSEGLKFGLEADAIISFAIEHPEYDLNYQRPLPQENMMYECFGWSFFFAMDIVALLFFSAFRIEIKVLKI